MQPLRLLVALLVLTGALRVPVEAQSTLPLLDEDDLTYVGAFRVPQTGLGGAGFDYAGDWSAAGMVFNPDNNSLFLPNHAYEQRVAEIGIPAVVNSTSLDALATAPVYQALADVTEGNLDNLGTGRSGVSGTVYLSGLLLYDGKLVGTSHVAYDGGYQAVYSHFTSGLTLAATGDYAGPYRLGTLNPAFYAGYMTPIPSRWQALFGGPALTGFCCTSIIGRTSYGPAAFVFDPDDLGAVDPAPATPLLYYDESHQTLEPYGAPGSHPDFNGTTKVKGVVFPEGSRSVLFFGRTGTGTYCYGNGGPCGDPTDGTTGEHAYPYAHYVWAYDANDLLDVKNGVRQPWDVQPYATWPLDLPFSDDEADGALGAAYDPTTQRVYFAASFSDDTRPVIHVLRLNVPPPPPVGSSACAALPAPIGPVITVDPGQTAQLPSIVAGAASGTTILLGDGTYTGVELSFTTPNVTLRSASGNRAAVVIDGGYAVNETIRIYAPDITIADLTVTRAYDHAIHVGGGGHNVLLYNLHVVDARTQQIKINPDGASYNDNGTIACSLVEMTDAGRQFLEANPEPGYPCYTGGIDAHQAWRWTVRDSVFKNIYCADGLAEHAIHFWSASRDTLVERNTLINNARGIGFGLGPTGGQRTYADDPFAGSGVVAGSATHIGGSIRNNVIYADIPVDTGIGLEAAWNTSVTHNTLYLPAGALGLDVRFGASDPAVVNNLLTPGITQRDGGRPRQAVGSVAASTAMFVDAATGDLHLVSAAIQAIDRGVATEVTVDIDGETRPRGLAPDVGADEFSGGIPPGAASFTDDPLIPGVTAVRAIHVQELRDRISALHLAAGLGVVSWTDPTLAPLVTGVGVVHINELRTALEAVYIAASRLPPDYTNATLARGSAIRAIDLMELRRRILAAHE